MKSSAPWSVKGIERDARETAKEAAKREGMTVGEWLNQIIYTAGSGEETEGDIEGLKLRDLVTAVEHLNKRIGETENKNADALGALSRNIGGVVERVQRLERTKAPEGSNADIAERVAKLEKAGGDRERIEALKALEKAVTQVASQFNSAHKSSLERLDANEQQLQALAARIDGLGAGEGEASGAAHLSGAISKLSERVTQAERIAEEAAALKADASGSADPSFVERTGERLRVLGDEIKRGGDQIRDLESTIAKLSAQIDAAERRSAEGVQKVTETISELREQFSGDAQGAVPAQTDAAEEETQTETAPAESAGANKIAPSSFSSDESDEEEEDPFAFADEIEAAIEETPDAGADFTFDLDDEDDGDERDSEARSLLSDVQEIFGKKKPKSDEELSPEPDAEDASAENSGGEVSSEDDLEALLADLDGGASAATSDPEKGVANEGKAEASDESSHNAKKAALFGGGLLDDTDADEAREEASTKEDFLQAARRRAKEAAEEAASEKQTRRKLTPKQRAILAARARQKRLAAARGEQTDGPAKDKPAGAEATPSSPEPASPDVTTDTDENEEDKASSSGAFEKVSATAAGILDKLPFIGKKPDPEETSEKEETPKQASGDEDNLAGNKAAFATLKSTAAARPVTLALGVAIFLAAAALFFLVKDLVLKSPASPGARPVATAQPPQSAESTGAQTATLEEPTVSLNVSDGPAIDPRALYIEAMTALNSAEGNDETIAAINTLEEAAALGHPPAQLQLGELYKTGQGVDQDLGQARTWFRRAANGGNVLAMHRIGVMTARGDGGPADTAEAIGWFELAANRGLVDSQYNLGAIYHPSDDGAASGVQDAGEAYYWYSLAAKNGDQQASPLAAGVAVALTEAERAQIDTQVAAWEAQTVDDAANEMAPAT